MEMRQVLVAKRKIGKALRWLILQSLWFEAAPTSERGVYLIWVSEPAAKALEAFLDAPDNEGG